LAGEYIVQPGHAFACAKSCVKQLESVYLTAPLATQVRYWVAGVRILLFVVLYICVCV
jgi:hypothetical protein